MNWVINSVNFLKIQFSHGRSIRNWQMVLALGVKNEKTNYPSLSEYVTSSLSFSESLISSYLLTESIRESFKFPAFFQTFRFFTQFLKVLLSFFLFSDAALNGFEKLSRDLIILADYLRK